MYEYILEHVFEAIYLSGYKTCHGEFGTLFLEVVQYIFNQFIFNKRGITNLEICCLTKRLGLVRKKKQLFGYIALAIVSM
jgi:hypothetical protein